MRRRRKPAADALREAGACLVGGHTVEDQELKYGLSVTGLIELIKCRFEDVGTTGITIMSTSPRGVRLRMVGCTLADPSDRPQLAAPILLQTWPKDLGPFGGIEFAGLTLRERIDRPMIHYEDITGMPLVDVTGSIILERGGRIFFAVRRGNP